MPGTHHIPRSTCFAALYLDTLNHIGENYAIVAENLSPRAYEKLIDQTVDMLTVVDESGVIQYESPSTKQVLGYDPEELVGENAFEYVHPDDQRDAFETFQGVIAASEDYTTGSLDFRFRHADGSWVWLEGRGSNQTATAIDGYVISSRDITERKEYEQLLQRERDRIERFAGVLSHDLRNPLNVAVGRVELCREECESDHLDAVARSLSRMDEILGDTLTLVRETEVQQPGDPVNLREAVETSWQNVETGSATLAVETDKRVLLDESKFRHMLENLVNNAVEHGGEGVTVTVGGLADGFYVEDDGPGIPEDDRDSSFDYGFSTKANRTGMGLSIVDAVVKSHGWDLRVTDGVHGGARFEITGVEVVE